MILHGPWPSHVAPEDAVKAQDLQHGGKGLGVLERRRLFWGDLMEKHVEYEGNI